MTTRPDRLRRPAPGPEAPEDGFSLIELMVVVLIIAILLAVAVPSFLGARSRALDRATQANVRLSLTSALALQADDGFFPTAAAMPAAMSTAEPSMSYVASNVDSADFETMSVGVDAGRYTIVVAALSKTGRCYYVRDDTRAGTGIEFGTRADGAAGNCRADDVSNVSWSFDSWAAT
ncbi:MAG TPA: type II secretion system protein [Acidimicrobiales bacterium]|nr:type II secretion system protein [Acidimicrobiales bacterium]